MEKIRLQDVEIEKLANAINLVFAESTMKQKDDIYRLYQNCVGFDVILDARNRPLGETIRSAQLFGAKIKRHLNLDEEYGMNVVGRCDYEIMKWRMNQQFREAMDFPIGDKFQNIQQQIDELALVNAEFQFKLIASLQLESEERRARIEVASRLPERREITTVIYTRNPDVVAESLFRAAGICESCRKPAPFNRKMDGTPYLEVHHKLSLANGGEDTLENTIAVCPNCHRRKHFG